MISGAGRVQLDCILFVLHFAITTGLRLSGRVTFADLRGVETDQIHPQGAGLTIVVQRTVCYCRYLRRPIARTLAACCTTQRAVSKPQVKPTLQSSPLPRDGGVAEIRSEFI